MNIGTIVSSALSLILGDLFKKKPWRLWGIRPGMTAWRNFGTGSARRLNRYAQILFGEGWKTMILAKDIVDPAVPPDLPKG